MGRVNVTLNQNAEIGANHHCCAVSRPKVENRAAFVVD